MAAHPARHIIRKIVSGRGPLGLRQIFDPAWKTQALLSENALELVLDFLEYCVYNTYAVSRETVASERGSVW